MKISLIAWLQLKLDAQSIEVTSKHITGKGNSLIMSLHFKMLHTTERNCFPSASEVKFLIASLHLKLNAHGIEEVTWKFIKGNGKISNCIIEIEIKFSELRHSDFQVHQKEKKHSLISPLHLKLDVQNTEDINSSCIKRKWKIFAFKLGFSEQSENDINVHKKEWRDLLVYSLHLNMNAQSRDKMISKCVRRKVKILLLKLNLNSQSGDTMASKYIRGSGKIFSLSHCIWNWMFTAEKKSCSNASGKRRIPNCIIVFEIGYLELKYSDSQVHQREWNDSLIASLLLNLYAQSGVEVHLSE